MFAIIPAIYVSKTDVNAVLKESTPHQRHPGRVRAVLVVGEVSLAVVLLIAAAFMVSSLLSVLHVDPGFRADHVLTMHFSMPPSRYSKNEQLAHFCQQALERIATLPGVKSAKLLRRSADDAHSHDEVHRRWSVYSGARQPAYRRHARHQFAFVFGDAGHSACRRS